MKILEDRDCETKTEREIYIYGLYGLYGLRDRDKCTERQTDEDMKRLRDTQRWREIERRRERERGAE